ncbi:unnamed protein product, partial [Scytosiphon promiscuus]
SSHGPLATAHACSTTPWPSPHISCSQDRPIMRRALSVLAASTAATTAGAFNLNLSLNPDTARGVAATAPRACRAAAAPIADAASGRSACARRAARRLPSSSSSASALSSCSSSSSSSRGAFAGRGFCVGSPVAARGGSKSTRSGTSMRGASNPVLRTRRAGSGARATERRLSNGDAGGGGGSGAWLSVPPGSTAASPFSSRARATPAEGRDWRREVFGGGPQQRRRGS